ncbi:short-chain dehydrogenase/reductase (SDR) family protein [Tieghemostelium lacteum]|uniref:Short-chain dehydrogenase/reductase (SDR) family protein n=1 Tax=Tieghemostelium lacteum TaxID=361077 RepID=A0A151ZHD1_TIELA|nr:short-chain dehydrogenase/reductase (SDR) family protein [Tieghemostelium lacteum]|eukprot:KYQ93327.1 short-chain dehydrogenase/reductase (SDR) family protein [Tieghemostelium lacteum]
MSGNTKVYAYSYLYEFFKLAHLKEANHFVVKDGSTDIQDGKVHRFSQQIQDKLQFQLLPSQDNDKLIIRDGKISIQCLCLDENIKFPVICFRLKEFVIDEETLELTIISASSSKAFKQWKSIAEPFNRDEFISLFPKIPGYGLGDLKPLYDCTVKPDLPLKEQHSLFSKELYNTLLISDFEMVSFLNKIDECPKKRTETLSNVTLCLVYINNILILNSMKISISKLENHICKDLALAAFNQILYQTILVNDIYAHRRLYLEDFQLSNLSSDFNDFRATPNEPIKSQLIKVFDENGVASGLFRYDLTDNSIQKEFPTVTAIPNETFQDQSVHGEHSVVPEYDLFKENLRVFCNDILRGIDWGRGTDARVVLSGGSVNACLSPLPKQLMKLYAQDKQSKRVLGKCQLPQTVLKQIEVGVNESSEFGKALFDHFHSKESPHVKSDLDLFVITDSLEKGKEKILELAQKLEKNLKSLNPFGRYWFVRSQNSITLLSEYPYRCIQMMLLFVKSIDELILFYDIDCVCNAFDGENVYVLPRTVNSMNRKLNLIGPALFVYNNSRIGKYASRDYNISCFEYCKHFPRCDQHARCRTLATHYHDSSYEGDYESQMDYSDYIDKFLYGPEITFTEMDEHIKKRHPTSLDPKFIIDLDVTSQDFEALVKNVDTFKPVDWRFNYIYANRVGFAVHCYMCGKKWIPEEMVKDGSEIALCYNCTHKNNYYSLNTSIARLKNIQEKRYAIVTGGRIKIGYETVVFLLEAGYHVIVTSRFPYATQEKFKKYSNSQLTIYGLDFRNLTAVQQFIEYVKVNIPRIDVLINNAAQTIRRPRAYYNSLIQEELSLSKLESNQNLFIVNSPSLEIQDEVITMGDNSLQISNNNNQNNSISLVQKVIIPEDELDVNYQLFPVNQYDRDGEQLDLREKTSWVHKIQDTSTMEMAEVQLINVTVPFMLMSQLSFMMGKNVPAPLSENFHFTKLDWSFIVNVTSPEGSMNNQYNQASGNHVHTNMAKAALNMLTRTTAKQFESMNIYVCGVDTGWISHMQPVGKLRLNRTTKPPPLTNRDGAKRIIYPIFETYSKERLPSGVLFKNFNVTPW